MRGNGRRKRREKKRMSQGKKREKSIMQMKAKGKKVENRKEKQEGRKMSVQMPLCSLVELCHSIYLT